MIESITNDLDISQRSSIHEEAFSKFGDDTFLENAIAFISITKLLEKLCLATLSKAVEHGCFLW